MLISETYKYVSDDYVASCENVVPTHHNNIAEDDGTYVGKEDDTYVGNYKDKYYP